MIASDFYDNLLYKGLLMILKNDGEGTPKLLLYFIVVFSCTEIFSFSIGFGIKAIYLIIICLSLKYIFSRVKIMRDEYNLLVFIVVYSCFMIVNALFSYDVTIAFLSLLYRMFFFLTILILLIFYRVNSFSIDDVFSAIVNVLFVSCLFAIVQFVLYYLFGFTFVLTLPYQTYSFDLVTLGSYTRVSGFMNGPSEFGILLAIFVPYLLSKVMLSSLLFDKVKLIIFSFVIIITLSRTAYLALFVGVMFLVCFNIYNKKMWKYGLMLLPIILVILSLTPIGEKLIWRLFANDGYSTSSTAGHKMYADAAMDAFYASPIYGVGLGNFQKYAQDFIFFNPNVKAMTHSAYLEFLAEQGIIGFMFNIFLIIFCFIKNLSNRIILACFLAFLVGNSTYHIYNFTFTSFFLSIFLWNGFKKGDKSTLFRGLN